jgi:hypothetical protein
MSSRLSLAPRLGAITQRLIKQSAEYRSVPEYSEYSEYHVPVLYKGLCTFCDFQTTETDVATCVSEMAAISLGRL